MKKTSAVVAVCFLILGYEVALFVSKASVTKIAANVDEPDTVYVVDKSEIEALLKRTPQEEINSLPLQDTKVTIKKKAQHSTVAKQVVKEHRKIESFKFNPNTVSLEDLQRLGFSEKQAQSIVHYRESGGRFRRKSDFAKSFVVADSVYQRLEAYIEIPKVDINKADSTIFDELPSIGPFYSSKMVSYREELCGYSYPEQLMDIRNFSQERYDGLADLIICSKPQPYPLWELDEEELKKHPYIKYSARGIILYRKVMPKEEWTIDKLIENNVLKPENGNKLKRCAIKDP